MNGAKTWKMITHRMKRLTFGRKYGKENELKSTLITNYYKNPSLVNIEDLIVRRLTPTECGRLQGFPDEWCENLEDDNPSDEEINFWEKVWETHRQLISKNKRPKTRKQ